MINENSLTEKAHNGPRIRILFAVTSASTWCFFDGIMGMLRDAGFDPVLDRRPANGSTWFNASSDAGSRRRQDATELNCSTPCGTGRGYQNVSAAR
jgi:hypothetical protein